MVNGLKVEDRLEGTSNFTSWKFRVLIALEENDLLQFVEEKDLTEPEDHEEKLQFKKNVIIAKKILIDSVTDHLVPLISKMTIARDMFKTLEGLYEINNTSRALALRQQLHQVKMAKGESVMSFFMKISELRDQLSAIGDQVIDKDLVMLALNGLPHSWEPFIQSISGRSKLPKFDHLRADCIQEESRLAARGIVKVSQNEDTHVLTIQYTKKGRNWKKGNFKRNRDQTSDSASDSKKKKKDLSRIQCFRCDKCGHYARDCLTRPKQQSANINEVSSQKEAEDNSDGFLFISTLSSNVPTNSDTWLIDSGASRRIIGYQEHLSDLVEDSNLQVIIGDDARYSVRRFAATSLNLESGVSLHLSDLLFMSRIKRNLVSISAVEDKGYQIAFFYGRVLAWPKNSSIKIARVIGNRHENLYRLYTLPIQALLHDSSSSGKLWHRRLGHLHFKALPSLEKMVKGISKLNHVHDGTFKGCAMGKNIKSPFHSSERRSKEILDLVHSNLCGPMSVPSLSGFLYYVTFIDDYSRKTWIYFLRSKESDEVLGRFKEFKAQVENLSGRKIKVLRSDNGGEYTYDSFRDFYIEVGIKREFCVPYNPQQNGLAKRKNASIVEAAKAMIHDQDLQTFLWTEASRIAVYVQNRCPHRIL